LRQALATMPAYSGVTGTVHFTATGEADRTLYLLQVHNGQFEQVRVEAAPPLLPLPAP